METQDTLPDFISTIEMTDFRELICVEIDELPLWERGNHAALLNIHLVNHTSFTIDRCPFSNVLISPSDSVTILYDESLSGQLGQFFTRTREPLGSISEISFCLNTTTLSEGTHSVTINTSSISGVPYSYTWQFTIETPATEVP